MFLVFQSEEFVSGEVSLPGRSPLTLAASVLTWGIEVRILRGGRRQTSALLLQHRIQPLILDLCLLTCSSGLASSLSTSRREAAFSLNCAFYLLSMLLKLLVKSSITWGGRSLPRGRVLMPMAPQNTQLAWVAGPEH